MTGTSIRTAVAPLSTSVEEAPLPTSSARGRPSYSEILKSSVLIGGSSAVTVAFGILRTKALAMFLGPAGVGLLGLHSSIAELAHSIAGMGIQSSGVRQIAEAVGSGEAERIARTATVLRRISVLLGVLGGLGLVALARPVSQMTFGTERQTAAVAILSLAVLFRLVSSGQAALLQGMRRIGDLASMTVLAAVIGTAVSVSLVYFFREQGVVPSLVGVAAVSIATSWWYSRRVRVQVPSITVMQLGCEAAALLKLGFAFLASGLLTMGASYVVRIIVMRNGGFDSAGLYQAAWALGGLYVGFILQAMGADFYPRLTAVFEDNVECNRLVNEQARISMLLAGPGAIATLTFAPLVIAIFYSSRFDAAVGLLRWICLGMMLRVVAWPMGFIVLAKGAQTIFFWTEVAATIVHVGLAWLLVPYVGVTGAGIAFFGLYVWHGLLIYFVVRRLSDFRWSASNVRSGLVFLPLSALVFLSIYVVPSWLAQTIGTVAVLGSGVYSVRMLAALMPDSRASRTLQRMGVVVRA
jgi:PST family polysaccharide transporter